MTQYSRLRQRNAFLDNYKKEAPFADGLQEFDEAKAVVQDLIEEYEAAENPNYRQFDGGSNGQGATSGNDPREPGRTRVE